MVGNLPTRTKKPHASACPWLEIAVFKQLVSVLPKKSSTERARIFVYREGEIRPESRAPDGHDDLFGSDLLSVVAGKSGAARVIAMDSNPRLC